MSEYRAIKSDLADAIAIYDEDASVVWKALKSLAEDEYFSGNTDGKLWNKAVDLATDGKLWMRPAVSKDVVLYTAILNHPKHKAALDTYGYFRGVGILAEAQAYGDAKLKEEIIRVKEIQEMYTKPHNSAGRGSQTSKHTLKYFLALLIAGLIAVLLGGSGA
jgi:hypothetical protein